MRDISCGLFTPILAEVTWYLPKHRHFMIVGHWHLPQKEVGMTMLIFREWEHDVFKWHFDWCAVPICTTANRN